MDTVFTSDTHAYHDNIIKYCNRPYSNGELMANDMAQKINDALPKGGLLYHLGDWSMGLPVNAQRFFGMLNRNIDIILIEGNHDKGNLKRPEFRKMFKEIHPILETYVNGQRITMCHYSMNIWNKSHHGAWHLFGHSHNGLPDNPNSLSIDVGVDAAYARFGEFRPFTFSEIAAIMKEKKFQAIDHHGKQE